MKKLLVLGCFALAAVANAKEVVPAVTNSKEVVATPAPVVEEVIVAPVVAAPANYVNLRVGGDVWSRYSSHHFLDKDTKNLGYEIAVEGYRRLNDQFDLGLGVAYQDHAQRDHINVNGVNVDGASYKSVPVYLTAKHNMTYLNLPFTPYIKANGGYSFNFDADDINGKSTSVHNGAYWAAGVGAEYNNVTVDVMYGTNYATSRANDVNGGKKFNNDYQRVTLSVGYNFNF